MGVETDDKLRRALLDAPRESVAEEVLGHPSGLGHGDGP
jgi:hypothetical protein